MRAAPALAVARCLGNSMEGPGLEGKVTMRRAGTGFTMAAKGLCMPHTFNGAKYLLALTACRRGCDNSPLALSPLPP